MLDRPSFTSVPVYVTFMTEPAGHGGSGSGLVSTGVTQLSEWDRFDVIVGAGAKKSGDGGQSEVDFAGFKAAGGKEG